jgi:hypothetical protein
MPSGNPSAMIEQKHRKTELQLGCRHLILLDYPERINRRQPALFRVVCKSAPLWAADINTGIRGLQLRRFV